MWFNLVLMMFPPAAPHQILLSKITGYISQLDNHIPSRAFLTDPRTGSRIGHPAEKQPCLPSQQGSRARGGGVVLPGWSVQ